MRSVLHSTFWQIRFFLFFFDRCKLFPLLNSSRFFFLSLLTPLSVSVSLFLLLFFLFFFAEKGYTGLQGRAAMYSACLDDTHWKRQVCNLPLDATQHIIHSCIICWLRGGKNEGCQVYVLELHSSKSDTNSLLKSIFAQKKVNMFFFSWSFGRQSLGWKSIFIRRRTSVLTYLHVFFFFFLSAF